MSTAKGFKQQLATIRQQVINMVTSTAMQFKTYEAAGELDAPVKHAEGWNNEGDHFEAHEIELDGTIVVYYQGTETNRLQPKECSTKFLLDLLQEMEDTLTKLHT